MSFSCYSFDIVELFGEQKKKETKCTTFWNQSILEKILEKILKDQWPFPTCSSFLQQIHRQLGRKIGQGAFGEVFEACTENKCPTVIKKSLLSTPNMEKVWQQEWNAFQSLSKSKIRKSLIPQFYHGQMCKEENKKYGLIEEERYDGDLKQLIKDPFYSTYMKDPVIGFDFWVVLFTFFWKREFTIILIWMPNPKIFCTVERAIQKKRQRL